CALANRRVAVVCRIVGDTYDCRVGQCNACQSEADWSSEAVVAGCATCPPAVTTGCTCGWTVGDVERLGLGSNQTARCIACTHVVYVQRNWLGECCSGSGCTITTV